MKKFYRFLRLKSLLFALFIITAVAVTNHYYAKPAYACSDCPCGISDQQCIDYLTGQGYTNVAVISITGCDRYCSSDYPYNTTVHVAPGIITGYEDDPH